MYLLRNEILFVRLIVSIVCLCFVFVHLLNLKLTLALLLGT